MLNTQRLKNLRKEKALKQIDVANALNIERTTYVKYEKNGIQPPANMLVRLAKYFNVTTDYLLGNSDIATPPNQEESLTQKKHSELMQTLFDITKDFDKEEELKLLDYAEYIKNRSKKE